MHIAITIASNLWVSTYRACRHWQRQTFWWMWIVILSCVSIIFQFFWLILQSFPALYASLIEAMMQPFPFLKAGMFLTDTSVISGLVCKSDQKPWCNLYPSLRQGSFWLILQSFPALYASLIEAMMQPFPFLKAGMFLIDTSVISGLVCKCDQKPWCNLSPSLRQGCVNWLSFRALRAHSLVKQYIYVYSAQ